tara:strand:+ start:1545 stop:2165 length:621 start_codon:yes stop_codon:yes gene_type:complete
MGLTQKKILSIFFLTIFSAAPAMANCPSGSRQKEDLNQDKMELKWLGEPDENFGKCILFNNEQDYNNEWKGGNRSNNFGIDMKGEFNCGKIQMRKDFKGAENRWMGIMPKNSESYITFKRVEKEDEIKYLKATVATQGEYISVQYNGALVGEYNPNYSCKSSGKNIVCRRDNSRYAFYESEFTSKKLFRKDTNSNIKVCEKVEVEF